MPRPPPRVVRRAPEAYRLRAIVLNQPGAPYENMVVVDVPARSRACR